MRKAKNKIFYVYVDYTKEPNPRPFYVGKGLSDRVQDFKRRNKKWHNIANKYGIERKTVFSSTNEDAVIKAEINLIELHKTHAIIWKDGSGWGANFTNGGEGTSGRIITDELREKFSATKRGKLNPSFGTTASLETRLKMSISRVGQKRSEEQKKNISESKKGSKNPAWGIPKTEEWKMERSKQTKGKSNKGAFKPKLTPKQVLEIQDLLKSNQYKRKEIAAKYSVSITLISKIYLGKR